MKIAFDHQIFAAQRHGGITRYFTALVRELLLLGEQPRIVAPLYRSRHLAELSPNVVSGWRWDRYRPRGSHRVQEAINRAMSRLILSAWHPDVVHETYYAARPSARRGIPTVITVFDMINELFPQEFPGSREMTAVKRAAIRRADHVICISTNTRDDLIRLFDCPPDRVSVIHLAADAPPNRAESSGVLRAVGGPFILYVGLRSGYKNFSNLVRAFAESSPLAKDLRIVAFGGGPLLADERAAIDGLGLSKVVVQCEGNDAVLDGLYREAVALVYPSLYEGFGLPPLEAMARSCPIIASNTSSMPEVVGDAGELFDPTDPGGMARSIEAVAYSETYRRTLIERGAARVVSFSWRRCAEDTRAVYGALTR